MTIIVRDIDNSGFHRLKKRPYGLLAHVPNSICESVAMNRKKESWGKEKVQNRNSQTTTRFAEIQLSEREN
jgi:hypothetical protein